MRQKMKKGGSVKKMNMGGGVGIPVGGPGPGGISAMPPRARKAPPPMIKPKPPVGQSGPGGVLNFAYGGAVGFRARKDAIRGMMGGSGKAGVTKLKKGSKKSGVVKKKSGKKRSR
jgi:hypothetical protein